MEQKGDVDHTIRNKPDGQPARRYAAGAINLPSWRSRHGGAARRFTAHRLKPRVPAGQVSWRQLYQADRNRSRSVAARDCWRGALRSDC